MNCEFFMVFSTKENTLKGLYFHPHLPRFIEKSQEVILRMRANSEDASKTSGL